MTSAVAQDLAHLAQCACLCPVCCCPATTLICVLPVGLDPTWEETFEFPVADENTTRVFVSFHMGAEGEEKRIGDECE